MGGTKDITGIKFNYLLAIRKLDNAGKGKQVWEFRCDCGKLLSVIKYYVVSGSKRSCGCRRRKAENFAAINRVYGSYKRRSIKIDRAFTLTLAQFVELTQRDCSYCKVPPSQQGKSRTGVYLYNGLDRKNNEEGYTYENSIPCCFVCNSIKGKFLSYEDMLLFMSLKLKEDKDPWEQFRYTTNKKDKI